MNEYQIKIEFENSSNALKDLRKQMILSQMIDYMNGAYEIDLLKKGSTGCEIKIKGISMIEMKDKLIPLLKEWAGDLGFTMKQKLSNGQKSANYPYQAFNRSF